MNIKVGSIVELKSFHNTLISPSDISVDEDYWKLIGMSGTVIKIGTVHPAFIDMGKRVLVQFDKNIDEFGLACHNEVPNTLWIFLTDLTNAK